MDGTELGGAEGPPDVTWHDVAASVDVAPRAVLGVEVDGRDLVLWRSAHGTLCAVDRRCPHLDADLVAEGVVDGGELVCGMHFWRIDRAGHVAKVNVRGRRDHKVVVAAAACREVDGRVQVASPLQPG